jgi:hypothetical protein
MTATAARLTPQTVSPDHLPDSIADVEQLEDLLSQPTPGAIETLRKLPGDIMILGVAGKMGPTLASMIRRGSDAAGVKRRVIGVSRFSSKGGQQQLESQGVETIAADLLDEAALARLPEVPNIIYMAGMKFGSSGQEALTWAMNAYLPGMVCNRFRKSRIVAFSTGNIYGLSPVSRASPARLRSGRRGWRNRERRCDARDSLRRHGGRMAGHPACRDSATSKGRRSCSRACRRWAG